MRGLRRFRCWALTLSWFWLSPLAVSQIPGFPARPSNPSTPLQATSLKDPLRRGSPHSSVLSFVKSAQRGDYATAAKYLEISSAKQDGPELARKLLALMDSNLVGSINTMSDSPEGSLDDSTDPNIEVVGRLVVPGKETRFLLVRVPESETGPIWLVSRQTLDRVPELYELAGAPTFDRYLPRFLADNLFLGIPAGRWLAWLLSIPLALSLGWSIVRLTGWLWQMKRCSTSSADEPHFRSAQRPAAIVIALLLHSVFVLLIGIPVFYRVYYFRTIAVLLTLSLAWLGRRVLDRLNERAVVRLGGGEAESFLQLGYQLLKVAILVIAALGVLALLGFDTRTMLAGLGIGGIAVALAAQKTLENLIGGITLLMDKAVYVGDDCLISGRYVTVCNIGLRSVRAHTREGTDITFPNGLLAQSSIENLSHRRRFLIMTTLSLSAEISAGQLKCVIARVREMLYSHARVEQSTARFRLAGLQGAGYQIELFAYVWSTRAVDFMAVQEDIFFRITDIVESVGARWAIPTHLSYQSPLPLVSAEKTNQAERIVQQWRDNNGNPFPDFSASRIAEMQGTIAYPEENRTGVHHESVAAPHPIKTAV
jgi:MscS family membrane protein